MSRPFVNFNPYVEQAKLHPRVLFSADPIYEEIAAAPFAVVDLGCGNGHFLRDYLKDRPQVFGLGVERRYKRVVKSADKLEGSSARILHQDILKFLEETPTESFDEVWLQFPDPWPKAKHEKNRMVSPWFFEQIHRILKRRGRFLFRSDCRLYWQLLQNFQTQSSLFPIYKSLAGDQFTDEPQTLFQQKFLTRGITIYSLEFRKTSL